MNTLLTGLAGVCRQYRYTPKFLVVNSYSAGHQLLETLAQYGVPWLNVTPVTPLELALKVAAPEIEENKLALISEGQTLLLIDETLEELAHGGELKYFSELEGAAGLAGILKGPLMELRMAGLSADDIRTCDFVDGQKGIEISALLQGYEKRLQKENLIDTAALYTRALAILAQNSAREEETLYILPEQLELNYLSYTFLQRFTAKQQIILPADAVRSLPEPGGFCFRPGKRPGEEAVFSWLYDVENAPPLHGDEMKIFQAYGPTCEINEAFRLLKKDRIPADRAMLCYTSGETYLPLIFTLSQACHIPVTFGDGVPVGFTRPGKLLSGLLGWVEENHAVSKLYNLFSEGNLKVSAPMILSRLLRRSGIGWGRERYLPGLDALAQALKEDAVKAEAEKREGYVAYLKGRQEQVGELKEIISFILDRLPPPAEYNCLNFEQLCIGLAEILQQYARDKTLWDKRGKQALLEQLAEASCSLSREISLREAVQRLKLWLNNIRIGASGFEPGHLHVTSFGQGEWSQRPHTFLLGMDDGHFPGSGLQDPVLLDRERSVISPHLMLRSEAPEHNTYRLNRFLASRRGRITLSFSSFNPAEGRTSFPAAALLQAYRLQTGNPGADYTAFMNSLPQPAAYFPAEPLHVLSEEEWWASLVLHDRKTGGMDSVRRCYPHIHRGLLAEEARSGEGFTAFDGRITVDPGVFDPRQNKRTLSATRMEMLAACPFAYFLRHILRVEAPDEQVFDPGRWLDPMSRGLLLHQIYADYLRKTCARPAKSTLDRDYLVEIAEELIVETRDSIPPPSPVVYEHERKELLQGLEVFLRAEGELRQDGSCPVYLEVPFGLGAEASAEAGLGLDDPIELTLPDGQLVQLRGRIDRIDRVSPKKASFRVWDFKTGSTYGYEEMKYIKQGRQIQHSLYGIAAEAILRQTEPEARVDEAGYIFPTEKGEGERYLRQQDRRQEAMAALQKLLDLLAAGVFCATDDKERCKYCDYPSVCRYPRSVEHIQIKLLSPGNTELAPWKELQQYD